jgi:tyrosine-protein phosphatase SIW14
MRRLILFAFAFLFLSSLAVFAQTSTSPSTASASPVSATPVMRSAYGQKIRITGIRNAGKIDDSLYRGGQPRIEALGELKKLGITTIVDLRGEDPGFREREKTAAEELGIRFVHIPLGGFATPTPDQIAQFLSLFAGKSHEKVFVHCHYGEDRTGVFVASYRIAIDRWPAQEALNEMNFFGFNYAFHPAMRHYVRDFPSLLESAPALARVSNPPSRATAPVGAVQP